jgi:hypothetical protein
LQNSITTIPLTNLTNTLNAMTCRISNPKALFPYPYPLVYAKTNTRTTLLKPHLKPCLLF